MHDHKMSPADAASPAAPRNRRGMLLAILPVLLFLSQCRSLWFLQDDSFITFRYVRNFISGGGLVFNHGERVEGYTTFLWTLLLALPAKLGIDLAAASQYLGVLFGIGSLVLLVILSRRFSAAETPFAITLIAVTLLAANGAFAYWSVSGMETAVFTFLVLLSTIVFLNDRHAETISFRTPIVLVLLSLTRPEGAIVFAIFIAFLVWEIRSADKAHRIRMSGKITAWILAYLLPVAAFALWRLSYYGFLLPNTYYAKAGFSREYLSTGFDYFWMFARTYLLGGVLLLAPPFVILRNKMSGNAFVLFVLLVGYVLYVIAIGGDVLPASRFFIPVLPFIYLFVQESIRHLFDALHRRRQTMAKLAYAVPVLLAGYTIVVPHDYIAYSSKREGMLVEKMADTGTWLKNHVSPETVIAASTIGALGYYSELPLIDMLGLTDSVVAHRPERILGVASNWRERNYNVGYVLSRRPDWICFSTGMKPSAFAERALFTSDEFRRWYYPYYFHASGDAGYVDVAYKRSTAPIRFPETPDKGRPIDNDFVNKFTDGVNLSGKDDEQALRQLQQAADEGPSDFALLSQNIANVFRSRHEIPMALEQYRRSVSIDPRMIESHLMLAYEARRQNGLPEAIRHLEQAAQVDSEYAPTWVMLGQVYLALADTDRARSAFEHAIEAAPINSPARGILQALNVRTSHGPRED